jgi:hypothetical protein
MVLYQRRITVADTKRATIKTFVKQLSIKILQEDHQLEAIQRVANVSY